MLTTRRTTSALIAALVVALTMVAVGTAAAQDYPNKPVRMIVPFTAGGVSDVLSRYEANEFEKQYHQQMIVENKVGAGGNIATAFTAKQPADGYTIQLNSTNYTNNLYLYKEPGYKIDDLVGIAKAAEFGMVLVVAAQSPMKSLTEILATTRKTPLTLGNTGSGGLISLAALGGPNATAGFSIVPYKADTVLSLDLIGGQVNSAWLTLATARKFLDAKSMRALAVTNGKRLSSFPDVPSTEETIPGSTNTFWFCFQAPRGTPRPILELLNKQIQAVMRTPEGQKVVEQVGWQVGPEQTVDQWNQELMAYYARIVPFLKAAKIEVN